MPRAIQEQGRRLPSSATRRIPDNRLPPVLDKLFTRFIDGKAGVIFTCNLTTLGAKQLCDRASPKARKIVEEFAQSLYPAHYIDLKRRPIAIDWSINDAQNSRQIREKDGHAVARDE